MQGLQSGRKGYMVIAESNVCLPERYRRVTRDEIRRLRKKIKRQQGKLWRITAAGGRDICKVAANTSLPGNPVDGKVPITYERCKNCPVRKWERSRTV